MKYAMFLGLLAAGGLAAQESDSGFELRTTISEGVFYSPLLQSAPRDGSSVAAGFRAIWYPTWKISRHWAVIGAIETTSRPYAVEDFSTQGYGLKSSVLQGYLSYSNFWTGGSILVRAGQLSTAFGALQQRYDDSYNPLVNAPPPYGYYYKPVSVLGVAGAQVDLNLGKWDLRGQFANSSPVNPRSIFARDQYGNWAGGIGYTIRQGLHVGASSYHGPYLDRHFQFYFPGEAPPNQLPATAMGLDAQWGHGPWNAYGEWQRYQMDYRLIPTLREQIAYVEARRVLDPRWYVAARVSSIRANVFPGNRICEFAVGFRPDRWQIAKLGYQIQQGPRYPGTQGNTLALQLVTSFRAISIARD